LRQPGGVVKVARRLMRPDRRVWRALLGLRRKIAPTKLDGYHIVEPGCGLEEVVCDTCVVSPDPLWWRPRVRKGATRNRGR
jgi:hypothetical protein